MRDRWLALHVWLRVLWAVDPALRSELRITCEGGQATLTGQTATLHSRCKIEETVFTTRGVRSVVNCVTVNTETTGGPASRLVAGPWPIPLLAEIRAGGQSDDEEAIRAAASHAVTDLLNRRGGVQTLTACAVGRVIYLTGQVSDSATAEQAARVVAAVAGVTAVRNRMEVGG